jgi:hypothetical protein
MSKFVVTGMPAFNGEYPFEIESFTMRELQIIKRISGLRTNELDEAIEAGDNTLMLALAVIAVRRNGREWEAFEKLAWESEVGDISLEVDEEVADEAAPLTPPKQNDSDAESGEKQQRSGEDSEDSTDDSQVTSLQVIGGQS